MKGNALHAVEGRFEQIPRADQRESLGLCDVRYWRLPAMAHSACRLVRSDHPTRADEFENHARQRFGRFLGDEPARSREADQPAAGNGIREALAEFRTNERILVAPTMSVGRSICPNSTSTMSSPSTARARVNR